MKRNETSEQFFKSGIFEHYNWENPYEFDIDTPIKETFRVIDPRARDIVTERWEQFSSTRTKETMREVTEELIHLQFDFNTVKDYISSLDRSYIPESIRADVDGVARTIIRKLTTNTINPLAPLFVMKAMHSDQEPHFSLEVEGEFVSVLPMSIYKSEAHMIMNDVLHREAEEPTNITTEVVNGSLNNSDIAFSYIFEMLRDGLPALDYIRAGIFRIDDIKNAIENNINPEMARSLFL